MPLQLALEFPSRGVPTLPYLSRPTERPAEQWPWGQTNKLLPVKLAVRLLARQVSNMQPVVPLDDFKEEAAHKARTLGLWLARNDAKNNRRWGERLSAGFPIGKGRKERGSLNRYASQFVGSHRRSDNRLFGALFELQFGASQVQGTKVSVGLTEGGAQFARLPNPVLDNHDVSSALGQEEAEFYLDHIRGRVPGEVYAFTLILSLLDDGVNGREELNQQIRHRVELPWTDKMVNTQRAGAMARMYDLRLIDRDREGLTVSYRPTPRGLDWLRTTE
ncbi:MAG TPA: hypothetical protein VM075_04795 [Anaerolineae bacterium]|nr:hypothetical protein [Anaerolineae bacterium]